MTPTEHKTTAETMLSAAETPPTGRSVGPGDAEWLVIWAHAELAQALGTGTHYAAAESALTAYDTERGTGARSPVATSRSAHAAHAHALLADR